jgi:hypothetical protein
MSGVIGLFAARVMGSTWGRYLMIGLAILAGVKGYGMAKENDGRRKEITRRTVNNIKTMRRMQDAGANVATDRGSIVGSLRAGRF